MLLYTITHRGSEIGHDVPWSYLKLVAGDGSKFEGAVATCTNNSGEADMVLRIGEWREVSSCPKP